MLSKICSICGIRKKIDQFDKNRKKCKKCRCAYLKNHYQTNKEEYSKKNKKYFQKNKKKITLQRKNRYNNDPDYKMYCRVRNRLKKALKGNYKKGFALKYLGCSIEEFKIYLESQFYSHPKTGKKMTWKNHGMFGWHLDHIKPLSSFDLSNEKEIKKAIHYTNFQPLWAEENLKKSNKF